MTPLIFLKIMGLAVLEYVPRSPCLQTCSEQCRGKSAVLLTCIIFMRFRPVLDQNMYYLGAKLTSATFASALVNILPAITFLMALVMRMEKLRLRSLRSQAKVVGTVCTVAGAVLMILYHGPVVPFPWSAGHHHAAAAVENQSSASWLNGTVMMIGSCLCWSGFFILQVRAIEHDTAGPAHARRRGAPRAH